MGMDKAKGKIKMQSVKDGKTCRNLKSMPSDLELDNLAYSRDLICS